MKIDETIEVYNVTINSDLNEGRGYQYSIGFAEHEVTAKRIGKKRNVQGSDAYIDKINLYKIDGRWYGPVRITPPSKEDEKIIKEIEAKQEVTKHLMKKLKGIELTDEEIKVLYEQITK